MIPTTIPKARHAACKHPDSDYDPPRPGYTYLCLKCEGEYDAIAAGNTWVNIFDRGRGAHRAVES